MSHLSYLQMLLFKMHYCKYNVYPIEAIKAGTTKALRTLPLHHCTDENLKTESVGPYAVMR